MIEHTTKAIREALSERNGKNVYIVGTGIVGPIRVCDARLRKGDLQVKALQTGSWLSVRTTDSIYQN